MLISGAFRSFPSSYVCVSVCLPLEMGQLEATWPLPLGWKKRGNERDTFLVYLPPFSANTLIALPLLYEMGDPDESHRSDLCPSTYQIRPSADLDVVLITLVNYFHDGFSPPTSHSDASWQATSVGSSPVREWKRLPLSSRPLFCIRITWN